MRILYLEENPSDADLTVRALRMADPGIQVESVGTVDLALSRLDEFEAAAARGEPRRFDLALLDMNLPDGSGLGVVNRIRHGSLPMAAVVLTGTGDEETVLAALRSGADDYVAKRPDYWAGLFPILQSALKSFQSATARRQGSEDVALQALKLGASDYLVKSPGYLERLPPGRRKRLLPVPRGKGTESPAGKRTPPAHHHRYGSGMRAGAGRGRRNPGSESSGPGDVRGGIPGGDRGNEVRGPGAPRLRGGVPRPVPGRVGRPQRHPGVPDQGAQGDRAVGGYPCRAHVRRGRAHGLLPGNHPGHHRAREQ